MKFKKGDCIIVEHWAVAEARNVCVITSHRNGFYFYNYLDGNQLPARFSRKPMRGQLENATLLADFGVQLVMDGIFYWCDKVSDSIATFEDGSTRDWQDKCGSKYIIRTDLARFVRQ